MLWLTWKLQIGIFRQAMKKYRTKYRQQNNESQHHVSWYLQR